MNQSGETFENFYHENEIQKQENNYWSEIETHIKQTLTEKGKNTENVQYCVATKARTENAWKSLNNLRNISTVHELSLFYPKLKCKLVILAQDQQTTPTSDHAIWQALLHITHLLHWRLSS